MQRWLQIACAVWVGALLAAATIWLVRAVSQTILLFAAGLLIAWVLDPVLDKLERRKWTRLQAVVVVSGTIILLVLVATSWVIPNLVGQAQALALHWPEYSAAMDSGYQDVDRFVRAYAESHFPEYDVAPFLDAKVDEARVWLSRRIPAFLGFLSDRLVRSASLIGLLALLAIISFHFMMIIDPFRRTLRELVPGEARKDVQGISHEVSAMLGQYIRGQATMIVLCGCIATALMLVVRMFYGTQYSLVIGLVTGITYVIPWVGAASSAILAGVFCYVSAIHDPLWAAVAGVAAMTLNNQLCDQFLMPKIIGRRVGIHPLVVIFAILSGYQVMGFPGMIIATPVAASIKIILAHWLPLKKVEVKPGRPAPLILDLREAARMGATRLVRVTRRIEDVMGMNSTDAPETNNKQHEQEDVDDDVSEIDDDPAAS